MECFDFSRFDKVFAPVMILSSDLTMIYSNEIAKRQFPFLTSSKGLSYYYDSEALASVASRLRSGRAIRISVPRSVCGYMLFDPVCSAPGEPQYVHLYVDSDLVGGVSILTDSEIMQRFRSELQQPVSELLRMLRMAEHYPSILNDKGLLQSIQGMRNRLIRVSLFLSRTEDCFSFERPQFSLCDVDNLLSFCTKSFPALKYKETEETYVPMDRDRLLLVLVDILSNIVNRQSDGGIVSASVLKEGRQTQIILTGNKLDTRLDEPCSDESDGITFGAFSVQRRVAQAGGSITVHSPTRGPFRVTLSFPTVTFNSGEVMVREPSYGKFTAMEALVSEYLQLLGEIYSKKK